MSALFSDAPFPRIDGAVLVYDAVDERYSVIVKWRPGVGERVGEDTVDLTWAINHYPLFKPFLRDPQLFLKFTLEEDGSLITWTDDIDMAATTLEWFAMMEDMQNDKS